jgi:hypothetical protein
MIVLGDWTRQASYLRIDSLGARPILVPDELAAKDVGTTR